MTQIRQISKEKRFQNHHLIVYQVKLHHQPTNQRHSYSKNLCILHFFCPIPKPNWLDQSVEMTTTQKPKTIPSNKHHPLPFPSLPFPSFLFSPSVSLTGAEFLPNLMEKKKTQIRQILKIFIYLFIYFYSYHQFFMISP
jgi:hypothetical protein